MAPVMPLAMMPKGKVSKIISINAGRCLMERLRSMGFVENTSLKIKSDNRGAIVVDINGCSYALGKGMATKIMVQECSSH